ncbi:pseudaminic acid synthase [[Bacteroides] pectinophilus]|uniref:AFP-like domain-containing protein n=1 Tax=[Bacteroides] pectinophilus ATCC 43243 TaxID=483218 RepID=B7AWV2_9FIRM|nr:pseudaminic acid synthase [[Bacteroides] pectinophilus ATCC 43243]UWN95397.1 pseudaminic acid synthase [[Bacteroides] pectinophilus]
MRKELMIDGKKLSDKSDTYIIAEMSANHLHNLDRAKRIIDVAKECGADAIKLQTYRPDTITIDCRGPEFMATPGSPWENMNLFELYKEAYTPWEWHGELMDYAKKVGITCFSSPFDLTAIDFLEELNVPAYKIASFELNDIPLIKKAAMTGKPIIMSTGIADMSDIELALRTCKEAGNDKVILLKCVSEYPTPYEEINLRTLTNMSETFDCVVGVSDHSFGSAVAVAGVALGARVIEKHLTLSRKDGGPDGTFSMEPQEFKNMVTDIRNVEKALGKVTYELTEKQKKSKGRSRSLYVVSDIKKGEIFTPDNMRSIRPGYGLHTKYYKDIIGKRASCDIKKGTAMKWNYVEDEE